MCGISGTLNIFGDLSKAFDFVNHETFYMKLRIYDISKISCLFLLTHILQRETIKCITMEFHFFDSYNNKYTPGLYAESFAIFILSK